jgi:hypothetical protein
VDCRKGPLGLAFHVEYLFISKVRDFSVEFVLVSMWLTGNSPGKVVEKEGSILHPVTWWI